MTKISSGVLQRCGCSVGKWCVQGVLPVPEEIATEREKCQRSPLESVA